MTHEVRKEFPEAGEQLTESRVKTSFSKISPAEIEYSVIISNIAQVSCAVHQNEKILGVPVREYDATSRCLDQKEWEDLILWYSTLSTELEPLTWTKISGRILCWEQFKGDRDDVSDPKSTVAVLVMWEIWSYFDAQESSWGFHSYLELPPLTAEHSDVLEIVLWQVLEMANCCQD
jgi:hypothetical protein